MAAFLTDRLLSAYTPVPGAAFLATARLLLALVLLTDAQTVVAQAASTDATPETFAVHGQFTYVEQDTSGFKAPYAGANSLTPHRGKRDDRYHALPGCSTMVRR